MLSPNSIVCNQGAGIAGQGDRLDLDLTPQQIMLRIHIRRVLIRINPDKTAILADWH